MLKKSTTRLKCEYYNGCKKHQQLFIRTICRYCNGCKKTNNYLRDLYVGIEYLKWPYGNYNRKDVGITQCSSWSL
jgi:hypothetical protein